MSTQSNLDALAAVRDESLPDLIRADAAEEAGILVELAWRLGVRTPTVVADYYGVAAYHPHLLFESARWDYGTGWSRWPARWAKGEIESAVRQALAARQV